MTISGSLRVLRYALAVIIYDLLMHCFNKFYFHLVFVSWFWFTFKYFVIGVYMFLVPFNNNIINKVFICIENNFFLLFAFKPLRRIFSRNKIVRKRFLKRDQYSKNTQATRMQKDEKWNHKKKRKYFRELKTPSLKYVCN